MTHDEAREILVNAARSYANAIDNVLYRNMSADEVRRQIAELNQAADLLDDDTIRRVYEWNDGDRELTMEVKLTHEGVIVDLFDEDGEIGTWARTIDAWVDTLSGGDHP